MMSAPIHPQEQARLAALRRYAILDTRPEPEFDDLTRLASWICGTPIAMISLVDAERQWFKSKIGEEANETPRELSFCAHTILEDDLLEVPNALDDDRFRANLLVTGGPKIRFYAGAPLTTPDGFNLGSLCVIDRIPRHLNAEQRDALRRLGRQVIAQLELHRMVRQLESQSAFQKAILEGARSAIISTDAAGTILTFNAGAERMLGYSAAEVVGQATPALIHDAAEVAARAAELSRELGREIAPGFETFVANARSGRPEEREWTYIRKDGSRLPVHLAVTVLADAAGAVQGFLGIASDVTERNRAALELRRAKESAEAASKAKGDFLAVMSHEIRTPMNAIIGMTALLMDTRLEPRQREFVSAVNNSGEALLEIINDILDFSRIESSQLQLELENFDLRLLIEGVFELLAARAGEKGLEFVAIVAADVPFVLHGDDGRLRQVLVHLLPHSPKFTEEGSVVLRVSCVRREKDRGRLRFEITDTGIGIPGEKQALLFHPFTQADTTTRRRYGGTGLGLAICKRLVELMEGAIGVISATGCGSTFWFEMECGMRGSMPAAAVDFRPLYVVVAGGLAATSEAVTAMLAGWQVVTGRAASGAEVWEMVRAQKKKGGKVVVLVDESLPDMRPTELARLIAHDPASAGAHLVFMTHHSLMQEPVSPLHGETWLFKPVKQSQLFQYLTGLVRPPEPSEVESAGSVVAPPTGTSPYAGQTLRILVAEDHDINRRLTLLVLEKLGCRADSAKDGLEVISLFQKNAYDVVLMDCQMPLMDGFEATREIRRLQAEGGSAPAAKAYIIALTANALKDEREKCIDAGMDDYLSKPFRATGLKEALQRGAVALGMASPP